MNVASALLQRLALALLVVLLIVVGTCYYASSARADREVAMALTGGDPDRAPVLLRRYGCSGCHTIPGLAGADGKVAPPLVQLRKRVYIAGKLQNTPENLMRWIVSPQSVAPGSAMPDTGIDERGARDVAAFLYSN